MLPAIPRGSGCCSRRAREGGGGGRFAIRADEVRLAPDGTEAVVTAVDYQGAHVALNTRIAGDQDVLSLIPEAEFFNDPKNPGDTVRLTWSADRAHPLDA